MASLLSDTVRLDVPVHDRIDGETRYGTDIEFLHNVLAVGNDSCGADAQAVGNFFVGQSAHDEREYFDFTGGKAVGVARRSICHIRAGHILREVSAMCVRVLLQL